MKSWIRTLLYFLAVIVLTASVTAAITINTLKSKDGNEVIMSTEEYAAVSDLLVFNEAIDTITAEYYYDPPSREELIDSALKGMVSSLNDPYAEYFNAEEYEDYISTITGKYIGFGLVMGPANETGVPVVEVYENTPAFEAGILAGDTITEADGVLLANMPMDEATSTFIKDEGESIDVVILRGKESLSITMTASQIIVDYVDHKMFNHRTGYITISSFAGNCAEEFKTAIDDLIERGMECLVIDLRNNPGGNFSDVVSIADTILREGTIVTLKGRNDETGEVYSSNRKGIDVPLAVIVNENSASASEILAAAVQGSGAGIVVGKTTYGKGIVQTSHSLSSSGSWIKLTTEGYYSPTGESIHGIGVIPDIEVDLPDEMQGMPLKDIPQDDDTQLWAALDYVRELAAADN